MEKTGSKSKKLAIKYIGEQIEFGPYSGKEF